MWKLLWEINLWKFFFGICFSSLCVDLLRCAFACVNVVEPLYKKTSFPLTRCIAPSAPSLIWWKNSTIFFWVSLTLCVEQTHTHILKDEEEEKHTHNQTASCVVLRMDVCCWIFWRSLLLVFFFIIPSPPWFIYFFFDCIKTTTMYFVSYFFVSYFFIFGNGVAHVDEIIPWEHIFIS